MNRLIEGLLVFAAFALGLVGFFFLSEATFGVGLVGLGCLAGILARIYQATENQNEVTRLIQEYYEDEPETERQAKT